MAICKHYNIDCPSWDASAEECIEEYFALVYEDEQAAWCRRCQEIRSTLPAGPGLTGSACC